MKKAVLQEEDEKKQNEQTKTMVTTVDYHLFLDYSITNFLPICIISKCHCMTMGVLDLKSIMHSFPKQREES